MYLISELFLLFCVLIIASKFDFGLLTDEHEYEQKGGGAGGYGLVYITNNKKSDKYKNDLLVIGGQKGCSPTIIKNGGKKSKDINNKKVKKEYIAVPMPVKQYVPVPVMQEQPKPIIIQVKQPMMEMMKMPMKMDYGQMDYGMGMEMDKMEMPMMNMGYGHGMSGMDSKKIVTYLRTDSRETKDNTKEEKSRKTKIKKALKTSKMSEKY